MTTLDLNSPDRFTEIRAVVFNKASLRLLYAEVYQKYIECLKRCNTSNGTILEIGSGAGFAKEIIPEITTSDVVEYPGIDLILDATQMSFPDNSLSCICMFNVLHHISDTPAFFKEALRCLIPGGRICMVEPYPGWIGEWVYSYLHHENYDPKVRDWQFESRGPVSDGNNALPYVIFERDMEKFKQQFAGLSVTQFQPHTPLRYWLAGGLKKWSLLPKWAFGFFTWIDNKLIEVSPNFGSFVDIELVKL
jgi:SAM-dependent methyltransferase